MTERKNRTSQVANLLPAVCLQCCNALSLRHCFYGTLFFFLVLCGTPVRAALVVTEEFASSVYSGLPGGNIDGTANGGIGWDDGFGSFGSNSFTFNATGLTYPGYGGTEGKGTSATTASLSSGNARNFSLNTSSSTLYYSFLATMDAQVSDNNMAQYLNTTVTNNPGWIVEKRASETNWSLTARPNSTGSQVSMDTGVAVSTNATLLVTRVDFNTGASGEDRLRLYVNPTLSGEPLAAGADIATIDIGSGFADIDHFRFHIQSGNSLEIDEIRIGESYGDLFPVPEPSTLQLVAWMGMWFVGARFWRPGKNVPCKTEIFD